MYIHCHFRCLEKNPDNRPFIQEIIEHPFLSELPENDYPVSSYLKIPVQDPGDICFEAQQS